MTLLTLLLFFLSSTLYAQPIPSLEWNKKSLDEKIEYLTNNDGLYPVKKINETITLVDPKKIPSNKKIIIHQFLKIIETLPTELYTEVEDDMYALIGPVEEEITFLFSTDQKLLGSIHSFTQQGCTHMDENDDYVEGSGHYETEAEANQNNCFDNDVSWSGQSYRLASGEEVYHSDFMEWTGH